MLPDIGGFSVMKLIFDPFCALSREKACETEKPPEHSDPSVPFVSEATDCINVRSPPHSIQGSTQLPLS